ncbi:hypothetical protein [Vagococcus acidifermentans]|uniref:hypothetical protein n=1 Tax=Vagococcus acidifermentans TaxID=564710 RepID=UPI001B872C3D|nr:hypothetical protein [Vagococcus acidifermentans]
MNGLATTLLLSITLGTISSSVVTFANGLENSSSVSLWAIEEENNAVYDPKTDEVTTMVQLTDEGLIINEEDRFLIF